MPAKAIAKTQLILAKRASRLQGLPSLLDGRSIHNNARYRISAATIGFDRACRLIIHSNYPPSARGRSCFPTTAPLASAEQFGTTGTIPLVTGSNLGLGRCARAVDQAGVIHALRRGMQGANRVPPKIVPS